MRRRACGNLVQALRTSDFETTPAIYVRRLIVCLPALCVRSNLMKRRKRSVGRQAKQAWFFAASRLLGLGLAWLKFRIPGPCTTSA
jgi:hypothetical protein